MSGASKDEDDLDAIQREWDEEDKKEKQMEKEDKEYQPLIPQFINDLLQRDETKLSSLKKDIIKAIVKQSGLRPSKLVRFLFSIIMFALFF